VNSEAWVAAPGCYGIFVGDSSRNLPLHAQLALGGAAC
jgi:hypothetical protein